MLQISIRTARDIRLIRCVRSLTLATGFHTRTLFPIETINQRLNNVEIDEFRKKAFIPETPILITTRNLKDFRSKGSTSIEYAIPALEKWFASEHQRDSERGIYPTAKVLSQEYLSQYANTILPYELLLDPKECLALPSEGEFNQLLKSLIERSPITTFHRFNSPLSFFLEACREPPPRKRLYIAQAQITDLPSQLQADLPTPRIVKEVGKGDIYDANIWMGIPPTYTPLHKDPNPNLFVQLASQKKVRIFKPSIGRAIFWEVQQKIGQNPSSVLRGDEMMEGPERIELDEAVWGDGVAHGFEAVVYPGDALFIPKGWWHSFKSIGTDVTASVNWWFR